MSKRKGHPGTLERRGPSFRAIIYAAGKRHSFTIRTTDRKEAEEFARQKERQLAEDARRRSRGLTTGITFMDVLKEFEAHEVPTLAPGTRRAYEDSFRFFRVFFDHVLENPRIDTIGSREIKQYLAWRRTRKGLTRRVHGAILSNRTLQKDHAVLHRIFAFADQMEFREGNPVARVERPSCDSRTPVLLSDEQYEGLLKACEYRPMLWLYVLVLGETGGRCQSEILHLRWEDVDLMHRFINIQSGRDGHRTKSGKSRYVPMTRRLYDAMRAHFAAYRFASYAGTSSPWIFYHVVTRRNCQAGERVKSYRAVFDKAASVAGLPDDFHRHDLRHRRVTTWLAKGANPVHVREAMGHADLKTTMGYTHLSKEHLRSLVETDDKPSIEVFSNVIGD